MKNKIAVFMIASALAMPAASLWADDASQPVAGTATTAPATKAPKKHHGHHHKKAMSTSAPSNGSSAPETK